MVSLARKNLLHDRLRFVITVAGVAFAVTLVLVQVGLFMGLLDKATVTIENATPTSGSPPRARRTWTSRTPSRRPRCCGCAACPGSRAPTTCIVQFMNIQLPSGAEEGGPRLRPRRLHRPGTCPGRCNEGNVRDLKRGGFILMDRSAERRFGPFAVGRVPRDPGPALQDHRHHERGRLVHHRAHRVHGLQERAGAAPDPPGQGAVHAGEARAGRRRGAWWPRRSAAACPTTTSTPRTTGRGGRAPTGWSRPASA